MKRESVVNAAEQGRRPTIDPPALSGSTARDILEAARWDDVETKRGPRTHVDDEYATSTAGEPRLCVTTSHDPSSKLKEFAKELRLIFPTSVRVNRGQKTLTDLVQSCRAAGFSDLLICTEHRGDPDGLVVSHLPHGPTARFSLFNCITRHDIGKTAAGAASEAHPHLVFENFDSVLGRRLADVMRHLFPVPKPDSRRVVSFVNYDDVVAFRHHVFKRRGDGEVIELREVGPRFEMRPYQITLGTLDQASAEIEWALRSFINKRRPVLSDSVGASSAASRDDAAKAARASAVAFRDQNNDEDENRRGSQRRPGPPPSKSRRTKSD